VRKTIVCLANSYKHGGRCVAGVCVEDGSWVRLRGKAEDGALEPAEYLLDDGSEARLLDAIEVELHYALPSDWHPEDWVIAQVPWRLADRPVGKEQWEKLAACRSDAKAKAILRDHRDRVAAWELKYRPMQASLALVRPKEIWWWVRPAGATRKYRAVFRRGDVSYDFAVTDPRWLERLNLLPPGIYPHATFVDEGTETWLTVSLSEAFFGWHYKLVAGVIVRAKA